MGGKHQKWKMFMTITQQNILLKHWNSNEQPAGVITSVHEDSHEAVSSEFIVSFSHQKPDF